MKHFVLYAAFTALLAAGTAAQQESLQFSNITGSPGNAWLVIPHSPELEPDTVTLEAWITPQGMGQGATGTIGTMVVGKVVQGVDPLNGSAVASYWLGWRPLDGFATAGYSRVLAGGGSAGDNNFVSSNRAIQIGERAHVAFTFDGHRMRMYVNGVQTSENLTSIAGEAITGYGQDDVLIGAANLCCNLDMRFDGIVDEVRIWDHARTAQEIMRKMSCRLAGTEPGLVGYWNFDGADFHDRSPSGNDGTMIGSAWSYTPPAAFLSDCGKPRPWYAPIVITLAGRLFL